MGEIRLGLVRSKCLGGKHRSWSQTIPPHLWLDYVIAPHQMSHPTSHNDNYVHLLDLVWVSLFYVSPGDLSQALCVLGEHTTTEPQA